MRSTPAETERADALTKVTYGRGFALPAHSHRSTKTNGLPLPFAHCSASVHLPKRRCGRETEMFISP